MRCKMLVSHGLIGCISLTIVRLDVLAGLLSSCRQIVFKQAHINLLQSRVTKFGSGRESLCLLRVLWSSPARPTTF